MNLLRSISVRRLIAALLTLYIANTHAASDDAKAFALAKQNACLGCHALDKKIVGPGFQEVAKKYVNDPNAKAFLKNKVLKGGSGSWGVVPMPANNKLTDADAALLAAWVLRGAPSPN